MTGPDIRIVSNGATTEDIAAVTAVLQAALAELADGQGAAEGPTTSAWERSQRPMRRPLVPGHGQWRGFSG